LKKKKRGKRFFYKLFEGERGRKKTTIKKPTLSQEEGKANVRRELLCNNIHSSGRKRRRGGVDLLVGERGGGLGERKKKKGRPYISLAA